MTTFVTADEHVNHPGILKYVDRPWSAEEMTDGIADAWNAVVGKRDSVYVCGDFAYAGKSFDMLSFFKRLNGEKHLGIGNHDQKNKEVLTLPWKSTFMLRTHRENGRRFEMCHYPLASWKDMHRGSIMLHGHSHGSSPQFNHRFDVGIDALGRDFNFGPIPIEAIVAIADTQPFTPSDHHDV